VIISELITSDSAAKLISLIEKLAMKSKETVEVRIDCDGGSTEAAMRLYDVMRNSGISFRGIVLGKCMSAAVIILQACNERIAYSHSSFLLHHPKRKYIKVFDPTKITREQLMLDIAKAWDEALKLGKKSEKVICSRLRNRELYESHYGSEKDSFFGADEALEMGLIDKIVE